MQPIQVNVYCYFMKDYLKYGQSCVETCYQRLVTKCNKEGWQIPTLDEMQAWLDHTLAMTNPAYSFEQQQLQQWAENFLIITNEAFPLPTGVAKPIARQMRFASLPDEVVICLHELIRFSETITRDGCGLSALPFHSKTHWKGLEQHGQNSCCASD